MSLLDECSVDAIVTDPPYGLSDHRPDEVLACLSAWVKGDVYKVRSKGGFMGKSWDAWVPGPEVWREALRVLKPGGHLLCFAGTRSMDLMCMAVRLAGFELRDSIGFANDGGGAPLAAWAYGTGFPKSLDVSKAIDKAAGAERECTRPGTVARNGYGDDWDTGDSSTRPRFDNAATEAACQWQGWGTALKPAWEPIVVARKPLVGTVAANVLAHGTGALNIDGCRVPTADNLNGGAYAKASVKDAADATSFAMGASAGEFVQPEGRWPANLIHDGNDEVLALFPQSGGQRGAVTGDEPSAKTLNAFGDFAGRTPSEPRNDTGSAARFFYCAKASKADREEGNDHPTVKPTDLMRYLCRLVTPPGGLVLDPFTGSGSTGKAAKLEGFRFIGFELSPEYAEIARRRIG
jgi:hypothetical protein